MGNAIVSCCWDARSADIAEELSFLSSCLPMGEKDHITDHISLAVTHLCQLSADFKFG